ncbi:MAG: hypothetical protein DRG24_00825 [Epsilonproteobacteria bacterium]|nr:MAG: hypothetical protein DRG24_00825 [Campylobacterota bacterium]
MKVSSIMKKSISYVSVVIFIAVMNGGCTQVGPDYVKPVAPATPSVWEQNLSKSDHNITSWWKNFNDETLDLLVQKAYEENLDLKSAGLRILQARAALGISEGLLFPQQQSVGGSAALNRSGSNTFGSAGVNFNIGWEMDVWGRYARGIQSAEATLYASVASYDDILVSIISEVARNYINYRTSQERKAYALRNIAIQERVTIMTEVQFNAGNVSELDMQQARTQLYSTRSRLPVLEISMINSRNAIAILLGTIPEKIDPILKKGSASQMQYISTEVFKDLRDGIMPHDNITFIPVAALDENISIDTSLVLRRPDLQIAERQAQAQSARIGSAEAELYPHFSLFGTIGLNTNNALDGWISGSDMIGVSMGPTFNWNILQYDRIKNQIRIQDALFQESLSHYNKKVLQAVGEISNALNGYRFAKLQARYNKEAVDASTRAFNISMIQYNNGLVTYQRLLSTVEKLTLNEDNLAQIQGKISNNVVALYKALGGGWQMGRGKAYVSDDMITQMRARTDWSDYLDEDAMKLPKEDK